MGGRGTHCLGGAVPGVGGGTWVCAQLPPALPHRLPNPQPPLTRQPLGDRRRERVASLSFSLALSLSRSLAPSCQELEAASGRPHSKGGKPPRRAPRSGPGWGAGSGDQAGAPQELAISGVRAEDPEPMRQGGGGRASRADPAAAAAVETPGPAGALRHAERRERRERREKREPEPRVLGSREPLWALFSLGA